LAEINNIINSSETSIGLSKDQSISYRQMMTPKSINKDIIAIEDNLDVDIIKKDGSKIEE